MPSIIDAPLGRGAFEAALRAAGETWPFEETRFHRLLASGRCPDAILLRYARATYAGAKLFCATLADLADKAPDAAARLVLIENLMEEEGIFLRAEMGLVVRPERRHPALALRFLKACGGDRGADDCGRLHAIGPGRQLLAQGRWLDAVSFLLIGQELTFSHVSACLFDLLRRRGMSGRDLAFFAVHVEADCAHGRQALDLVLDRARTADAQRSCIQAAGEGARHWFEMHNSGASARRAA
ncbi:MAG: pyrroloquinoline-quinone synthase [Sphingomonadales bacterium]|jgi:pyrroloquinoline quinone (PQQ) biosynthesis protein C|nr:pyrroloquinoline-quinone synthase [Sphingomonadales bacterium]